MIYTNYIGKMIKFKHILLKLTILAILSQVIRYHSQGIRLR